MIDWKQTKTTQVAEVEGETWVLRGTLDGRSWIGELQSPDPGQAFVIPGSRTPEKLAEKASLVIVNETRKQLKAAEGQAEALRAKVAKLDGGSED